MTVPIDPTGGLTPELEYFMTDAPADADMRDSASLWVMDTCGAVACPRITVDAIGADWDAPWVQINVSLADGRVLRVWSTEPRGETARSDKSICRAGPLRFQCVDPFRHWLVEFDGDAELSTVAAQMVGDRPTSRVPLTFRFEAEMAAPPWLMGGMTPEAARKMKEGSAGALMGGIRYEQLCRVKGALQVGAERHVIDGTGMRVRRQGVRRMGAATGHCQHSALFPSGRAFGAIAFAPNADGSQSFNEGFVYYPNGERSTVRMVQAPWMTRLIDSGDDTTLHLEAAGKSIIIRGTTLLSTFDHHLFEMADNSVLSQGAARYIWDGEETIGLVERCAFRDRLEPFPHGAK